MKKQLLKPLIKDPNDQSAEKRAAFLRERIYGGVTVLAVNVGMLFKTGINVQDAYVAILSTIGGLWLASMFAGVLSYRIIHDKTMPTRLLVHELTVHRGLLLAAVPSLIMFSLAAFELVAIRTAIIADIALALITLTIAILRSSKTQSNSYTTALISLALQAGVAGLIVLVKLGAE